MKWAGQLMRTKPLQKIMAEMTDRIAAVLEDELKANNQFISDWVQYPHSHSVSPQRNTIQLEQLAAPVWYPEQLPASHTIQTARKKHRQLLNELAIKNRKEREMKVEMKVRAREDDLVKQQFKQQVLTKMASRGAKKHKGQSTVKKPEKPLMTPYQEALHERLAAAQAHIDTVMQIDDNFAECLQEIESELKDADGQKSSKNPGHALKNMLTKWSEEPMHTPDQFANYRNELWMSLEQYEQFLDQQESVYKKEVTTMKEQFRCRVDGIRASTSFRIEALESALIETKLRLQRERERAEMRLAEMESTIFNQSMNSENDQMERVNTVEQTLNDPAFQHLDDNQKAKLQEKCIKRLTQTIRSGEFQKAELKKQVTELAAELAKNKEISDMMLVNMSGWLEQLLYYQQTLYDILHKTGILEMTKEDGEQSVLSEDKLIILRELMELNEERQRQEKEMKRTYPRPDERKTLMRLEKFVKDFHEVILTVNFKSIFHSYQEVIARKTQSIGQMAQNFFQLGVFDLAESKPSENQTSRMTQISVQESEHQSTTDVITATSPTVKRQPTSKISVKRKTSKAEVVSPEPQRQKVITLDIAQIQQLQQQFTRLAAPIQADMPSVLEEIEKTMPKEPPSLFGMEASRIEEGRKKEPKEQEAYLSQLKKKQQKRVVEHERREKRAAKEKKPERHSKNMRQSASRHVVRDRMTSEQPETDIVSQRASRARLSDEHSQKQISKSKAEKGSRQVTSTSILEVSVAQRSASKQDFDKESKRLSISGMGTEESQLFSGSVSQQSNREKSQPKVPEKEAVKLVSKKPQPAVKKSDKQIPKGAPHQTQAKPKGSTFKKNEKERKLVARKQTEHELSNTFVQGGPQKDTLDHQEPIQSTVGDHVTEPLDPTLELLEDLEQKVLLKYKREIEQAKNAPARTFKLKAGQNKEIHKVFLQSLGQHLLKEEESQLLMTGNLVDMVNFLNATAEKRSGKIPPGIRVQRLEDSMRSRDEASEEKIPLRDCILTKMDEQGHVVGFKIRKELVQVLMYRENGKDIKQILKVIETVNLLNRILFDSDQENYALVKRGQPGTNNVPAVESQTSLESRSVPQSEASEEPATEEVKAQVSEEMTQLLRLLKRHSITLEAKGNQSRVRYQERMQQDQTVEELMNYRLQYVFEKPGKTGRLTFSSYLKILLEQLEKKIRDVLPSDLLNSLSVEELVFYAPPVQARGSSADLRGSPGNLTELLSVSEAQNVEVSTKPKKSSPKRRESLYSQKVMAAKVPTSHKMNQTEDELLVNYLKNQSHLTMAAGHKLIEQQVWQELGKTITSLNDYVSKVQLQSQLLEKEEKSKQQKARRGYELFDTNRKSIATQISSSSPASEQNFVTTFVDQLRAINAKVQTDGDLLLESLNEQKERQVALRTAELMNRNSSKEKKLKQNVKYSSQLPRLADGNQIQSERNCSQTATCEVSRMPLLHNSNTKQSSLVHQPFKQVHVDKHLHLTESTHSRFSTQGKERELLQAGAKTGQSQYNPPGLTAHKIVSGFKSPEKGAEITILDSDFKRNLLTSDIASVSHVPSLVQGSTSDHSSNGLRHLNQSRMRSKLVTTQTPLGGAQRNLNQSLETVVVERRRMKGEVGRLQAQHGPSADVSFMYTMRGPPQSSYNEDELVSSHQLKRKQQKHIHVASVDARALNERKIVSTMTTNRATPVDGALTYILPEP